MKIKWLYKIPLVTAASALVSPMIVSCSVEKPTKVETQEEKEKRLEYQRALQIAPNLTKFMKEYNDKLEKGDAEFVVDNIKQLKEHTASINHLNDFEKSYLGLYEDIQNFFDNSIHRYTPENLSFEYLDNTIKNENNLYTPTYLTFEESTLKQEQMLFHNIYKILQEYSGTGLDDIIKYKGNSIKVSEVLKLELTPIVNEKIAEFAKKHKNFQFKNSNLTFRIQNKRIIIEVTVEIEYDNKKLPKEIIIPLKFDVDIKASLGGVNMLKRDSEFKTNKKVKTFVEMENILKSRDNDYNRDTLKHIEEEYNNTIKAVEDKEVEM